MLPRRMKRHFRGRHVPQPVQEEAATSGGSNNDEGGEGEGIGENPEQAQAMDEFLGDWFHDMRANEDAVDTRIPQVQPTRRRNKEWEEAEAHAKTPIYDGAQMN